jgi:hypothetical protein
MSRRDLFRDVLNEGSAAEFEEAVFQKALGTARRARRIRVGSRCAVAMLVAAIAVLQFLPRRPVEMANAPQESKEVPLGHMVLNTQPFTGTIRSERIGPGRLLVTGSSVVPLRTGETDGGDVRLINDEELLALFAGKPVALVHRGPNSAELVFLEEEPRQPEQN